jgi:Ca-activated chloride channel homolog
MLARRIGMHCRYCAAAKEMGEFARGREGDAFGLTLLGSIPIVWVPLSEDVSAIYRAAQLCYPDHLPNSVSRSPDTAAGIRESVEQLAHRAKGRGGRLLILLTDGEDRAISRYAAELTELMNREDVTLAVLLFQNPGSSPTLATMAQRTESGGLFDCSSSQELAEVFRTIDNMKKIEYEVSSPQELPDDKPWVAAAIALCALYLLSLIGLRFTPW